jgi:transposase-like protein
VRVEELARGGDATEIAQRDGVTVSTLTWWRFQLRKRAQGKSERPKREPRLLPVVVGTDAKPNCAPTESSLEVLVEVGATRMTLRGAVTAEQLAAIVAASRAC